MFFFKKKIKKKLIWFHGASVGEISSIIPLVFKLEENKKIDQILITSSTLSSANVLNQFKFKKTIHQFFPIDTNHISKKFLNYWKPSLSNFYRLRNLAKYAFKFKKKINSNISSKCKNYKKVFQ